MKHLVQLIFFLAVYTSCEPPVVFTTPQPDSFPQRSSFDLFYRGRFFCDSDSATVVIGQKVVYKEKKIPFVISQDELDTSTTILVNEDHLIINSLKQKVPFTIKNNRIYSEVTLRDTIFKIGPTEVLTRFRGHHLMNRKIDEDRWEVAILSLNENLDIEVSIATVPADLERLNEITPVEDISRGDTIQYRLSPTVYEFNQILEEELIFESCDYFRRLRMNKEI